MLDLEPRVHLEEVEAHVGAEDELDRAGRIVADGLGQRDGLGPHRGAERRVHRRRRRLLDDLLVPPLHRAFALAEVDDVAVLVAEHLDLDVPRALDEALDEHPVVAEGGLRLRARPAPALAHLARRSQAMRMPLPPPPAEALIITGKPTAIAAATASASVATASGWPGTVETLASSASFFDAILSPIAAIAAGFGPMKAMPAAASASANSARSDRNP